MYDDILKFDSPRKRNWVRSRRKSLKARQRETPSLISPVQTCSDVLFDVLHAVVGQVTNQNLPPQIQDLIHHMPQPVEQISFVLLRGRETQALRDNSDRWRDLVLISLIFINTSSVSFPLGLDGTINGLQIIKESPIKPDCTESRLQRDITKKGISLRVCKHTIYHIKLLPYGAPFPQCGRHLCNDRVFCGHHGLKLPAGQNKNSTQSHSAHHLALVIG